MDTFSVVVILLISFLAWQTGIGYAFLIGMVIAFIMVDRWSIRLLIAGSAAAVYLNILGASSYFIIIFLALAGLTVMIGERKPKEPDYGGYSPELMRLLGN